MRTHTGFAGATFHSPEGSLPGRANRALAGDLTAQAALSGFRVGSDGEVASLDHVDDNAVRFGWVRVRITG